MSYPTKKILECIEKISKKPGVPRNKYQMNGVFPVIDQGQDFIGGYTNDESLIYKNCLPVVVFGDHTRAIKFIDFPFAVGADGIKVLKPKDFLDAKYFYFALRSLDIELRGYARHFRILKEKVIILPPLSEQKKIAAKLEKTLAKISEAKKLRHEAQEAAQNLLSAELHKIFSQQHSNILQNVRMSATGKNGWEEKELGEICEINPKKSEIKNQSDNLTVSFVPMKAVDEFSQEITSFDERKLGEVQKGYTYFRNGDVLFAKITPCMENGKVAIARNLKNGIGFGTTEFHVIRPGEGVLSEWIYAIIRHPEFRDVAKTKMTGSAGQKRVPIQFLENYKIPLPPLAEQKKIVAHLDSLSEKIQKLQEYQKSTQSDFLVLEQSVLFQAFSPRQHSHILQNVRMSVKTKN